MASSRLDSEETEEEMTTPVKRDEDAGDEKTNESPPLPLWPSCINLKTNPKMTAGSSLGFAHPVKKMALTRTIYCCLFVA